VGTGIKQQGREADHQPAASAQHKNALSYTSTPLYAFLVCSLIMHRYLFKIPYLLKLRGRCGNCNFTTFGCALGICIVGIPVTTNMSLCKISYL
jgi:hypothetical protein